jgi:hypothetical protein
MFTPGNNNNNDVEGEILSQCGVQALNNFCLRALDVVLENKIWLYQPFWFLMVLCECESEWERHTKKNHPFFAYYAIPCSSSSDEAQKINLPMVSFSRMRSIIKKLLLRTLFWFFVVQARHSGSAKKPLETRLPKISRKKLSFIKGRDVDFLDCVCVKCHPLNWHHHREYSKTKDVVCGIEMEHE